MVEKEIFSEMTQILDKESNDKILKDINNFPLVLTLILHTILIKKNYIPHLVYLWAY